MNDGNNTQDSKGMNLEKVLPHVIGAIVALTIIIGTGSTGAHEWGKAGAFGYVIGWLVTMGALKVWKNVKKM